MFDLHVYITKRGALLCMPMNYIHDHYILYSHILLFLGSYK